MRVCRSVRPDVRPRWSLCARHRRGEVGVDHAGQPRLARDRTVEFRTYRVTARLLALKREADSDIHLVIADPKTGGTMITEFPLTSRVRRATTAVRAKMVAARSTLVRRCGSPSSSRFTAAGSRKVRGVLPGRVHPAATARPRLSDIPYRNFRVL